MIDPKEVELQGAKFALRIMETLALVLPSGNLGFTAVATTMGDKALVVISQAEDLGLGLTVDGQLVARLVVEYRCELSEGSKMLAVTSSWFKVFVEGSDFPMFALDYVRDMRSSSPAAHWNVYANRKDVSEVLLRTGSQRRGDANRRAAANNNRGVIGAMHFPVGGHRFRPCLEDVLDMLWTELSIDVRKTARGAIESGRQRWREYQLAAAVSDDPLTAAKELLRLGAWVRSFR